jgi:hypothetical protein
MVILYDRRFSVINIVRSGTVIAWIAEHVQRSLTEDCSFQRGKPHGLLSACCSLRSRLYSLSASQTYEHRLGCQCGSERLTGTTTGAYSSNLFVIPSSPSSLSLHHQSQHQSRAPRRLSQLPSSPTLVITNPQPTSFRDTVIRALLTGPRPAFSPSCDS